MALGAQARTSSPWHGDAWVNRPRHSAIAVGMLDMATDKGSDFWMRASIMDGVSRLQVSTDGKIWPPVRLPPFPLADFCLIGPMCRTPERQGLKVRFSDWTPGAPLGKTPHDLT
ncbi:DUF1349 domain-containing protein [Komagataeibacter intermedius]|uniref:Regulation of enolase 1 n=2 Tax=Komagataeibacter intermedius TaxID=66229 RepID=A0A0N1FAJ8_9PROT|nr:DUF1349 domain-containing protein [Komagataeibacter intermedius]KPH86170.1 regulation of enolase 1 [Komagataeibacter intermedius AF2]MCF3636463.1 DUF1349 domain-containing protein [Komagataeibacter intermedius]